MAGFEPTIFSVDDRHDLFARAFIFFYNSTENAKNQKSNNCLVRPRFEFEISRFVEIVATDVAENFF